MQHTIMLLSIASLTGLVSAQTVLSGYDTEYIYNGFGDVNLAENQDRITDNVWITRAATRGIFNIAQEFSFTGQGSNSPSPIGTMWALGTSDDFDTLTYGTWGSVHDGDPSSLIGQNVVVYLEDDDTYIDLRFTSWGGSSAGGAFSYVRSTVPAPSGFLVLSAGLMLGAGRRR